MKFSMMSPLTFVVTLLVSVTSQDLNTTTSPEVNTTTTQEVTTTTSAKVSMECNCLDRRKCDVTTGHCQPGAACALGYWNPPACQYRCHCKHGVLCNATNGNCTFGCAVGWSGIDCSDRICPAGKFGLPSCRLDCHCAREERCHPTLGSCGGGPCAPGYWGPFCQGETAKTKDCDIDNPECKLDEMDSCYCKDTACKLPPGKCRSGSCPQGMTGDNCDKMLCPFTTYQPPACNGTCHCRNKDKCHPVTGGCGGEPCDDGWAGPECQQKACPPMYFGYPDCKKVCFCKTELDLQEEDISAGRLNTGRKRKGRGAGRMDARRKREERRAGRLDAIKRMKKLRGRMRRMGLYATDIVLGAFQEPSTPLGKRCDDVGACSMGCKEGWRGVACNQRSCPPGKWGFGHCDKDCHCQQEEFCNSHTGFCELGGCLPGWDGYYCHITVRLSRLEAGKSGAGEPSQYIGLVIVLVGGCLMTAISVAICVSVRNSQSNRNNGDRYRPVNREETHVYEL